jgi:hypothetical protein
VAVCERIAAPVLVGIVRPIILLPPAALTGWSPDEIEMVLLHELAHVRRWDNLVNLVQRIVESLLFFHPAVWLVSNWVRREREACCDAAVVRRTNRPHAYAELLLAFATRSPLAGLAFACHPVRARIRRILGLEDDPMLVSGKSLALVMSGLLLAATLVVLNLPTRGQAEESTTESTEDTESPAADVAFVEGASRFEDGDKITITKVRGTSKTFEPGGTYWIEGTYMLASRDRATLLASVTARNAGDGRTLNDKDQTTDVKRGSGTFRLKLPMPYVGWPHVSYYPADGGDGFGGVYFGTGDSVLENWSDVYGSDDLALSLLQRELAQLQIQLSHLTSTARDESHSRAMERLQSKIEEKQSQIAQYQAPKVTQRDGQAAAAGLAHGDKVDLTQAIPPPGEITLVSLREPLSWTELQAEIQRLKAQGISVQVEGRAGGALLRIMHTQDEPRFPSLEDQKLADLLWRRMALELEPISGDDVKRVKALGYSGGLKVRYGRGELRSGSEYGQIQFGDILVGLHVWPTPDLQAVADVLNRDDLAELNPLKFYLVRAVPADDESEMFGRGMAAEPVKKDTVITGRISVNMPASQNPYTAPVAIPPIRTAVPGEAGPVISVTKPEAAVVKPQATLVMPLTAVTPSDDKPILRYDGKTFDVWWREWWATADQSPQQRVRRRIDILAAFEAFAAAGYGQRATEMILVASYDDEEYIAKLARHYLRNISPEDSVALVSDLVRELERDLSPKRRLAAMRALAAIGPNAKPALEVLTKTLASDNRNERPVAATAIKMIVGKDQYQKPLADVLGKELGITAVQNESGAWGVVPRDDARDGGKAFNDFTSSVIEIQQDLFPSKEQIPND